MAPVAIARAVFLGAMALAGLEAAWVLVFSAPSFDGLLERVRFVLVELALFAPFAVALGACGGGLMAALARVGTRSRGLALAALAAPASIYVGWEAFAGPSAQKIPGHQLGSACIAALGIGSAFALGRALPGAFDRLRAPGPARRYATLGLALVVLAAYAVDQRVLPRLYPFFHRGLEAMAMAAAALAVVVRSSGLRRPGATAVSLILVGVLGFVTARGLLARYRVLGTIVADRAPAGAVLARMHPRAQRQKTAAITREDERAVALPPGPRLGSRDIILVTVDAWRADRLRETVTPNMSAIAARGVRFDEAYTQVPHTSFSIATLLTGKYVYALSELGLDAASHETLAEVLRRERYKTAAFYPPAVFFIDHDRLAPLEKSAYGFEYVKYEYLDAKRRTDQIIDFFETEQPARAFVWVHYLEPHEPYEVHPGYTAGTTGAPPAAPSMPAALVRYEGEVRYVDAEVGRLVAYLQRTRPQALVVLAADHGEEFGEHGGRYHGTTLFDEQVRVPLVFAPVSGGPTETPLGPRAVAGPVGLVDVAPTILALLGVPSSARMRGRDLSPWMGPVPPPSSALGPIFAEIDRKKMVVDGAAKLACDLETGACALYDRTRDPKEARDESDREPVLLDRLRAELDRFLVGESRFEAGAAAPPGLETVFERARLGDAKVAPRLVEVLPSLTPAMRLETLRILASMPTSAVPFDALGSLTAEPGDAELFLTLLRARGGEPAARDRLRQRLLADRARPDGDPARLPGELFAQAALAVGDATLLATALDRTEQRELVIALAEALARTKDAAALDALLVALAPVRSRAEVATAIGMLGDPRAIGPLGRWLSNDPYVPVRVAMVNAIARLEPGAGKGREALIAALRVERDGPVLKALCEALPPGRYGDMQRTGLSPGRIDARATEEVLVISHADGEVRVEGPHPGSARFSDGVARIVGARGVLRVPPSAARGAVVVRPIPADEEAR